ncbi:class I SAM-dependent methyltransferase [Flagellimonas sp. CMM7]|uniref:class I SAM-dependent methyltransferase n=1 Tax=Flagellimonas sp. CMM7 TaxID=2654676 RepID=UPI0013D1BE6D|nr:class I SAM-dependent methyltransferase [Flagellimonas sp. CMM7]UII81737.1 class I SAM-dependent methyltransferase [Flagellimonas sp. CMM7]
MKKNIAIFEGNRANNYDDFAVKWIPNYDYYIDMLPKLLNHTDEKNALIVGCGTGNEMKALAESSEDWSLTGVDPSPEMIALAKEKLRAFSTIELFTGKLEHFKNTTFFNAATLSLVLHFIKYPKDKLALLQQVEKRLKPGSPFIIMGIFGNGEQLRTNLEVLELLLENTVAQKEIDERFTRIKKELHRTSEEELKKLLVRAGFKPPTRFFQTSIYSAWITHKID